MKKSLLLVLAVAGLLITGGAVLAQDDMAQFPSCGYCGMKRPMFAFSRMLLTYDDGSQVPTCSIHCSAVDLALHIDKTPTSIQVGDFKTQKLIDAESAVWVIGGQKPGVMSKRGKWAFADQASAEAFAKENGGEISSFEKAMKATYEDMYADTQMIRDKRKAMKMQKK